MMTVLWKGEDSLQYFDLGVHQKSFVLTGNVVLLLEGQPAHVQYRIECDQDWKTRQVEVTQEQSGNTVSIHLTVDTNQVWQKDGQVVQLGAGLYDIDLEISPGTNTIPMRRLNLQVGESQMVNAVWVRFPGLNLERLHQRYTRISQSLYHYEAPELDFEARLEVDEQGVIINYENLWSRI